MAASNPPDSAPVQTEGFIQIVDVNDAVARHLIAEKRAVDFSTILGDTRVSSQKLGSGDSIEVSVWEAPPATLFGAPALPGEASGGSKATVLPTQIIDTDGRISVPFIGQVQAAGKSPSELAREIAERLKGKANDPQIVVRLVRNATSYVTVVGDVTNSSRMELTAGGERLLDALASAGGTRQAVDKTLIQITRGHMVESLPLQTIIRDPRQNVPLRAGDVITALFEPLSFTVLGASGKNDEINFEAQGITLSQALARAGGLNDNRSDPKGVFIFRMERKDAIDWPNKPVRVTADDLVPVIYRVSLKDPASFFVAQSFPINNRDLVYVSNAPAAELQKFLNLVFSVVYPVTTVIRSY
ncbi:polysaccharide export outer membrane protein [Paraburkholderia sp. JPY158]|uniref:Polysaccharide export outer membrane protein n=1 Tax=Paraburkholderia atlantica TaxID=2654982 RepID=A0A7W8V3M8_PARAM|nr:polysaccharide export outer membrane protein [Paraburkholderia atlantica]